MWDFLAWHYTEKGALQGEDGDNNFKEALTTVDNKGLNSTLAALYNTPGIKPERPDEAEPGMGQQEGGAVSEHIHTFSGI